jgi:hypothetical protein
MKRQFSLLLVLLCVLNGCSASTSNEGQAAHAVLNGNPEKAISYFRKIADTTPDHVIDNTPLRLSVWTYLGRAYYGAGKLPEAREAVSQSLKRDERDFIARLYLGLIFLADSRPVTKNDGSLSANDVLYVLKEKVSLRRIAGLVKDRGVNFSLSASVEKDLRSAGADDELISQIRTSSRPRAGVSDAPRQQGIREVERSLKEIQTWQAGLRKGEYGRSWDPRNRISTQVETSLGHISSKRTDRPEFVTGLESISPAIDEQIDSLRKK